MSRCKHKFKKIVGTKRLYKCAECGLIIYRETEKKLIGVKYEPVEKGESDETIHPTNHAR